MKRKHSSSSNKDDQLETYKKKKTPLTLQQRKNRVISFN